MHRLELVHPLLECKKYFRNCTTYLGWRQVLTLFLVARLNLLSLSLSLPLFLISSPFSLSCLSLCKCGHFSVTYLLCFLFFPSTTHLYRRFSIWPTVCRSRPLPHWKLRCWGYTHSWPHSRRCVLLCTRRCCVCRWCYVYARSGMLHVLIWYGHVRTLVLYCASEWVVFFVWSLVHTCGVSLKSSLVLIFVASLSATAGYRPLWLSWGLCWSSVGLHSEIVVTAFPRSHVYMSRLPTRRKTNRIPINSWYVVVRILTFARLCETVFFAILLYCDIGKCAAVKFTLPP